MRSPAQSWACSSCPVCTWGRKVVTLKLGLLLSSSASHTRVLNFDSLALQAGRGDESHWRPKSPEGETVATSVRIQEHRCLLHRASFTDRVSSTFLWVEQKHLLSPCCVHARAGRYIRTLFFPRTLCVHTGSFLCHYCHLWMLALSLKVARITHLTDERTEALGVQGPG
jgi:hypothetical protein